MTKYKAIVSTGESEYIEKKSRFIAQVFPIETQEEALEIIEKTKKKYSDARHNCFAFSVGMNPPVFRFSDDGEPNGTAGKPILEVILGEEINNILVIVTRYFGGTLLGTGGLVRAYTKAAQDGIHNAEIVIKKLGNEVTIQTNYQDIGKIQYILGNHQIKIIDSNYGEDVVILCHMEKEKQEPIEKELMEATNGKVGITVEDEIWFY